jgi:hypothetical protein
LCRVSLCFTRPTKLRAAHIQAITGPETLAILEEMKSENFRIHPDLMQEAMNTIRK